MKKIVIACVTALMTLGGTAVLALASEHQDSTGLKMSDVPPAVQKVIEQEAARHPLKSLIRDDDGAKLYESTFRDGKQQIELKIAANGTVVSREVERQHKEDQEGNDD